MKLWEIMHCFKNKRLLKVLWIFHQPIKFITVWKGHCWRGNNIWWNFAYYLFLISEWERDCDLWSWKWDCRPASPHWLPWLERQSQRPCPTQYIENWNHTKTRTTAIVSCVRESFGGRSRPLLLSECRSRKRQRPALHCWPCQVEDDLKKWSLLNVRVPWI